MRAVKLIALATICIYAGHVSAQDLIVKKDGSVIQAKVTKIGTSEVEYKKWSYQDGPQYAIAVADILAINYQNGEKETFENVTESPKNNPDKASAEEQFSIIQVMPTDLSPEARTANDALIAKYNSPVELNVTEKLKKKIGTKQVGGASAVYGIKSNTIVSNEDIEINFTLGVANKKRTPAFRDAERDRGIDQTIMVKVRNKSSNTIYLDLGNTFYVYAGQSVCYYVPTSTTTAHGSQGGIGVSLGAVTGALGVGGVVGTLANGVSVGGGSTKSTTTTTYSQRVVAVPPMGSIDLASQYMFGNTQYNESRTLVKGLAVSGASNYGSFVGVYFPKDSEKGAMLFGDRYVYTEENSPLQLSTILAYSFKEDCSFLKTITSTLYLRELIGTSIDPWHKMEIKTEGILYNHFGVANVRNESVGDFPRY